MMGRMGQLVDDVRMPYTFTRSPCLTRTSTHIIMNKSERRILLPSTDHEDGSLGERVEGKGNIAIMRLTIGSCLVAGLSFYLLGPVSVDSIDPLFSLHDQSPPGDSLCRSDDFTKMTLKTAFDQTFTSLIKDTKGQSKFEASDLIILDNKFYTVCDNSWAISVVGEHFTPLDNSNYQIGSPQKDSDFESIVHDNLTDTFYLIRESQPVVVQNDTDAEYHAIVVEVQLAGDGSNYNIQQECVSEIEFDDESKGFEGAISMRDAEGNFFLLGLCEGNTCNSGDKGKIPGGGRIVVMKKEALSGSSTFSCQWSTVRMMDIPSNAYFEDYSAIAFNAATGKLAITSQQYAQIWIGDISLPDGAFDSMTSELVEEGSKVLNFPRDDSCNLIYCNVEGIHWLSDTTLVGVSDKMKSGGRQDYRCKTKDQSIHLFALP